MADDAGSVIRRALEQLMGSTVGAVLPPMPNQAVTWGGVVDRWGGRSQVADYHLGKASRGTVERRRFLARLRNWENGKDRKADRALFKKLANYSPDRNRVRAQRKRLRKDQPPLHLRSFLDVLNAIRRRGMTVSHFSGEVGVHYTGDVRTRSGGMAAKAYFFPPGELGTFLFYAENGDWDEAANELASLWGEAYGIDRNVWWGEIDSITIRIGDRS